ncbi:PDZK1-interacting protein 1 isoform X2 [Notolabrus celidotus]|uniref:PDZK1-interacting protein 1 isoform X2 n=1 Tax=Notolabrus celidotus TaxID=1203425 RepID=UPI0014908675|nr:PDZK1-interacting protein 1 isoform X2 [Notolabrus celidotus]
MERLSALISCLLLTVGASSAQTDFVKPVERLLPQWLTGLIAVVGFLFLTFVLFLVNRAWCDKSDRSTSAEAVIENDIMTEENTYETSMDLVRRKSGESETGNTYQTTLDLVRRKSGESETGNTYQTTLDLVRNKDEVNTFYNQGFDSYEEKVTSM